MTMQTLPEVLTEALDAQLRDDRRLIFINGEDDAPSLSFAELKPRALALLGALQARGVQRGDYVLLHVNDNRAFLESFWACVLGGIVAVPVAVGSSDSHRGKLFGIRATMPDAWLITEAATLPRLQRYAGENALEAEFAALSARALLHDALHSDTPGAPVAVQPDDVAFIQFSSGSTSTPKGVVLTHRNLMTNIDGITAASGLHQRDIALSWMPLTHDMGLIGFHLHMLAAGITHAIMRTDLFARRPLLWLHKAAELRASALCSPNFGYQHALRQYAARRGQDAGWDLSAVRLIFNGAEPIAADLARRFMQAMAAHGLPGNAMFPVYGLAEASLAVTFPEPGAPMETVYVNRGALRIGAPVTAVAADDPRALELVRLGRAIPGTEVRIAGEDGTPLPADTVGHVHIRGGNVTAGYFRNPEANAAALAGDGWLGTGDVGFLDSDGGLVITGRSKDIIFVNGQNYYPHDLEAIAEEVPGIETNKIAVVGARLPGGEEEAVVALVLHRGSVEGFVPIARAVRRLLNRQTGLEIARVYPVAKMPKTTSGKLQRHVLKQDVENGVFAEVEAGLLARMPELAAAEPAEAPEVPAAPPADTRAALLRICAQVLPDKSVALDTDLFEINIDSMKLARLHEAIDALYPDRLDVTDLFDYPTLNDLAEFLDQAEAV